MVVIMGFKVLGSGVVWVLAVEEPEEDDEESTFCGAQKVLWDSGHDRGCEGWYSGCTGSVGIHQPSWKMFSSVMPCDLLILKVHWCQPKPHH